MEKTQQQEMWRAHTLRSGSDILHIPEVAIELPVVELYEDVIFPAAEEDISR
jgi:hypothetical protein